MEKKTKIKQILTENIWLFEKEFISLQCETKTEKRMEEVVVKMNEQVVKTICTCLEKMNTTPEVHKALVLMKQAEKYLKRMKS